MSKRPKSVPSRLQNSVLDQQKVLEAQLKNNKFSQILACILT